MINKIAIRSVNNLLRLHSWTKLSNYVAKFCTVQSSESFVQAYKKFENQKDVLTGYTENVTRSTQKNDDNAQNAELFEYMNEFRLFANEKMNYDDIKDSKHFLQICRMIQRNARSLSTHDTIKVLRFLFSLNTPNDTVLIVTLLQLLKCSINRLTVLQIILLHNMLQTQNETELIKALLEALKAVFRNRIQIEDVSNNTRVLKFARNINDKNSITYIMNALSRSKEHINVQDAVSILHAFSCELKLDKSLEDLLIKVNNVIVHNWKSLEYNTIKFLLHKISTILEMKIAKDFYFEQLINVLCEAVMMKNGTFHEDIEILSVLNTMRCGNKFFMDYITQKCIEDPQTLTNCLPNEMINFVEGMNISSYKTKYWDTIGPLILKYAMNTNSTFSYTAPIAFHLLSLDFFNEELLDHVFSLYNNRCHNIVDRKIMFYILQMHQCVKTLYPEYQGSTLSQDAIDNIIKHTETKNILPLKKYLKEVVGGNKYIRHNMRTKLGHTVDHVIILQPDGTPLIADDYNNSAYVEDIEVPIECCRILIVAVPVSLSCRYSLREHSTWQTTVASLRALTGCNVVSINLHKWFTISTMNRKLYLKQTLKPFNITRLCNDELINM